MSCAGRVIRRTRFSRYACAASSQTMWNSTGIDVYISIDCSRHQHQENDICPENENWKVKMKAVGKAHYVPIDHQEKSSIRNNQRLRAIQAIWARRQKQKCLLDRQHDRTHGHPTCRRTPHKVIYTHLRHDQRSQLMLRTRVGFCHRRWPKLGGVRKHTTKWSP